MNLDELVHEIKKQAFIFGCEMTDEEIYNYLNCLPAGWVGDEDIYFSPLTVNNLN